ncbi:SDR family oxidoreductase [Novosphingobium sp. 9U]|uniref:SDR family oxidoreductase n=1 Tax=Novosphingobium sp. 9U TaxID=2653158 RepID=UPI001F48C86E|nr:SDR family oxidoreductase [Novosphingobium sp. 9U]
MSANPARNLAGQNIAGESVAKTIVITGAGLGLGRALARRFASEGETLVLLGRTFSKVQALAQELGDAHLAVECDVASPDSVRAAFATIAERFPKIDVLINNAAIYEPFKVVDATDAQIAGSVATNLAGPIYCCRSAIPMMAAGGQIINISSESIAVPFAMLSLYQSTKSGLERFSEALAAEVEELGIRVTTVRAGQMYEIGKEPPAWDPQAAQEFYQRCMANGLNLRERPISNCENVTGVFRALLDLPADVQLPHISVSASKH